MAYLQVLQAMALGQLQVLQAGHAAQAWQGLPWRHDHVVAPMHGKGVDSRQPCNHIHKCMSRMETLKLRSHEGAQALSYAECLCAEAKLLDISGMTRLCISVVGDKSSWDKCWWMLQHWPVSTRKKAMCSNAQLLSCTLD